MDWKFGHPEHLHLLWLVLLLIVVTGVMLRHSAQALRRFASDHLLTRLAPGRSAARRIIRLVLALLALLALVAALLDPRWGRHTQDLEQRGNDLVILLDVSRSMLAEDASPSRLERARQLCLDIVEELHGDRVALITFAGTATLRCPLTVDYGAFRLALNEAGPESAARGGSLLGDAVRLASEAFTDEVPEHKAIIVLSDGEDHGSFPIEAAGALNEERGIRIYTVGIGDESEGARIPVDRDGQRVYLTYQGEEVWSKMTPDTLTDMAVAGGGAFIPAGTRQVDMGRLYSDRIAMDGERSFQTTRLTQFRVQYQWFAAAALVLLLIEGLMSERGSTTRRRTQRMTA